MEHRPGTSQAEQYTQSGAGRDFFLFRLAGHNRALVLLMALIAQIMVTSLGLQQQFLLSVFQTAVILAAVSMAADSRRHLVIGLLLGVPGALLSAVGDFFNRPALHWTTYAFVVALYLFIIRLMLRRIFIARIVSIDTIGYALCTYVLLGSVWTLLYAPFAAYDPQAFSQPLDVSSGHPGTSLIYFSFVTLTTLGYGDISPVSPVVRSLAILQALTGTLFLAVLISRLVGSYGAQNRK